MDEKEFKKVLKIHGYLFSDEESTDSGDSTGELDELYELYKPRPIQIDPKKDKIIIIGSKENYLDVVKEKFELDLHTKELVNKGEKKLTKNQRRRLNRRLRKSTEILDKIGNDNDFDDNDVVCDNEAKNGVKKKRKKKKRKKKKKGISDENRINHVASTESILSEFDDYNAGTKIGNDNEDSYFDDNDILACDNETKNDDDVKKKSIESILSEFVDDYDTNDVEVNETENDTLLEAPMETETGAKKKTRRRKRRKKKPPVEDTPQSTFLKLLTNLNNSITNHTNNSFRIHLDVQEILKFLTRTAEIPPTIRCICKIIIEVSFGYQMFLKNLENLSDPSIKLLFYNFDTIILRNTEGCEFFYLPENYFEYCGLTCVLINLLEKVTLDVTASGIKNQNLKVDSDSFDIIQRCEEFNLEELGRSISSCRSNNHDHVKKFPVVESVIKQRLFEESQVGEKFFFCWSCLKNKI